VYGRTAATATGSGEPRKAGAAADQSRRRNRRAGVISRVCCCFDANARPQTSAPTATGCDSVSHCGFGATRLECAAPTEWGSAPGTHRKAFSACAGVGAGNARPPRADPGSHEPTSFQGVSCSEFVSQFSRLCFRSARTRYLPARCVAVPFRRMPSLAIRQSRGGALAYSTTTSTKTSCGWAKATGLPRGLRHLRGFLLPQLRTATERVKPQANDAGTFLMQTELHGLPTPAENVLGTPSTATTILPCPLRQIRPAPRPSHLARSKPDIFQVAGFQRYVPFNYRGHSHHQHLQSHNQL